MDIALAATNGYKQNVVCRQLPAAPRLIKDRRMKRIGPRTKLGLDLSAQPDAQCTRASVRQYAC